MPIELSDWQIERLLDVAKSRVHGTPTYAYFPDIITGQIQGLWDGINSVSGNNNQIMYAMKANSNPWLVELVRDARCGLDTVSEGEVIQGRMQGFPREKVFYTESNATPDQLKRCFRLAIPNLGSEDAIKVVAEEAKWYPEIPKEVGVRICTRVGAGHHEHCFTGDSYSKFGIWFERVAKVAKMIYELGLKVVPTRYSQSEHPHSFSVYRCFFVAFFLQYFFSFSLGVA